MDSAHRDAVHHRCGASRISVYDASLEEWASDPSLPIEVG
jgi:3-mercaptopyruvate sulfurtransferase SseA